MKMPLKDDTSSPSLEDLLAFAASSSLSEVVWERGPRRVAFKRAVGRPSAPLPPEPAGSTEKPVEPKSRAVKSPMVGTFLRGPKGRPPLVAEGEAVTVGQRLGIVEAMQVPKDVVANVAGRVVKVLVENGRPVEYGQPLVEIEPSEGA